MNWKKWLKWAAIAFVVFYLFSKPVAAANSVNGLFDGVMQGAGQLATFVSRLSP